MLLTLAMLWAMAPDQRLLCPGDLCGRRHIWSIPVEAQRICRMGHDLPTSAIITSERPNTADAILLISELEAHLDPLYPRASRHGLSVEQLLAQEVAFFLLRWNGAPASCGGVQLFGADYGEVKRMYVRPQFRGLGFGKMMLHHLADFARARGVGLLRLETGIHQHEAIGLYEHMGFCRISPFGAYTDDPLSLFYEKHLV